MKSIAFLISKQRMLTPTSPAATAAAWQPPGLFTLREFRLQTSRILAIDT